MKNILFTGLFLLVTLCAMSQSVPKKLSFQGYLTDDNDKAIHQDGLPMTFTLYSGTSVVWGPETQNVNVINGRYSVILGETESMETVAFDAQYDLQVEVDGTPLTPRIALTSSPYSMALISTDQIIDNAVTGTKLLGDDFNNAQRAVNTKHIKDLAITTEKLFGGAVTTAKIGDDQVTVAKLANGTADRALVTNGAGEPFWSTITNAMIGNNQVTVGKIVSGGAGDANRVLGTNGAGTTSWLPVSNAMIADDELTVAKIGSGGVLNRLMASNGTGDVVWATGVSNSQLPTAISQTTVSSSDYMRADGGLYVGPSFVDPANNLIVAAGQRVGIGTTSPSYTLEIDQPSTNSNYVIRVNKQSTNAGLMRFDRNAALLGYIYEGSGSLHFGPFTGSHLAESKTDVPEGYIVSLSGDISYLNETSTEPVYGVKVSSTANDASVLGVYLSRIQDDVNDHMAIAAVGNGDMWVIDNGRNIEQGDLLITSDVAGHAMVDNGKFGTLNVIARAAQKINWSEENQTIDGKKHKRISVLFESMVVNNDVKKLEEEMKDLRREIEILKSLIKN